MPYYDRVTGVHTYKDDACRSCAMMDLCNVYSSDLPHDGVDSKYNETHIVEMGKSEDRPGYIECASYTKHVPMNQRPDPNPGFGLRISEQEAAIRRDNPYT